MSWKTRCCLSSNLFRREMAFTDRAQILCLTLISIWLSLSCAHWGQLSLFHAKAEWHTSTAGTTGQSGQSFLPVMCNRVCNGKSEAPKTQEVSTLKVSQPGSSEPQDRQGGSRSLSSYRTRGSCWWWKVKYYEDEGCWVKTCNLNRLQQKTLILWTRGQKIKPWKKFQLGSWWQKNPCAVSYRNSTEGLTSC